MRACRFHEYGGPEVLSVESVDRPDPGPDELLVSVGATSVNPVDTYIREGAYEPASLPWIPGSDLAGTVAAVGADVSAFQPGDRVFGTGIGLDRPGGAAEYALVPTDRVARLPETLSLAEGAALALVGATAWRALIGVCKLEPAERVLIHGGSGGVGHLAVQIAAAAGARVTATAAPAYHDAVREFGADTVLDYERRDLADAVVAAGRPDVVLDHRADEYLDCDARVAAQGARIGVIGNETSDAQFVDVPRWRAKGLAVHHVSLYNEPAIDAVLDRLARLAADGELRPRVARRYALDEVPDAHRDVLADSVCGKLVVEV
ncbi:NADPH:quinone reductase [Halococcoides cellulosivorans]|uniref:Zinc-binding dehydrogenase n=1 Tax=Halococcoides cellulosivorans TaxID=1679096 RepID=A0A2R4X1M6_9EURY|nr:NADPH:quinone reductase [Halococcoides cellulosivorans]AWB27699.1 zinc-binding dehydrogenase [Halococcoides cellulosivorans]